MIAITMLVISSCNKCGNQLFQSRVLKQLVFQKTDNSVYVFDVIMGDQGFVSATDSEHEITIAALNGSSPTVGAGYIKGYVVISKGDTVSKVEFTLQGYSTSSSQTMLGMKSTTKDTTKPFSLGNIIYDFSSGTVTSTTDGLNFSYFRSEDTIMYDSLYTGNSGLYDNTLYCTYKFNNGPSRQFAGTKNYLYSEDISVWVIECAIGFSDTHFSDYNLFQPIRLQRNLDLDEISYFQNGIKAASYYNTYTLDADKYVVAKKEIKDISGKSSYINFVYR